MSKPQFVYVIHIHATRTGLRRGVRSIGAGWPAVLQA